jgi:hypothetical protein
MLFRNSFQDLRYALRQLRRAPGFAFTVVLTLALSVGVATAVFCVIDAVILRPLPYANPDKIVSVESSSRSGYSQPASWPSYQDERAQAHAFAALAGYIHFSKITMDTPSSGPVSLNSVRGTDNFFQVFGVQPILGRTFLPGEEKDGKNDIAVLSYEVWQKYFNGDRGVLNQAIKLDGRTYTVIGVMPAGFRFPLSTHNAIYVPIHLDQWWMTGRGNHWLQTVARVKDDMTVGAGAGGFVAGVRQPLEGVSHRCRQNGAAGANGRERCGQDQGTAVDAAGRGAGGAGHRLREHCRAAAGPRGAARARDGHARGHWRGARALAGQVLTEGILLALLGAGGGVLLATAMLDLMRAFLIKAMERGADIQMNWTVLGAAVGVAVVASLAASLYPALRLSGVDPNRALKAGGSAGTQRGQHRLRSGFVITQVALTLVLLVVSGLLIRVVTRYRHADLGFDPAHILTVQIGLSRDRYQGRDMLDSFYRPLEEQVSHLPGVQAAGIINLLPIEEYGSNSDIHIAGQPPYPPNQEMLAENRMVSTGYFDVMGIPLHAGASFRPSLDRPDECGVDDHGERCIRAASSFPPASIQPRSAWTTTKAGKVDADRRCRRQRAAEHLRAADGGARLADG